MTSPDDASEIRHHVESLFDAFLANDRETLREGRLDDWKGFQIRSTRLIHGVDQYMAELDKVLSNLKVERYEFLDFEVEVNGHTALVFYVARDWIRPSDSGPQPKTVLIRALDIYRKVDGRWIQAGSNICAIADDFD